MRIPTAAAVTAIAIVAGCSDAVAPGVAMPAYGLSILVAVPGRCLVGGCDPVSSDVNRLGLVTMTNATAETVFVQLCGGSPAIDEEELTGGQWINVGPAYSCANGPRSIAIAPRDSLQTNRFFAPGTRRLRAGVALDSALTTEASSTSASFIVK